MVVTFLMVLNINPWLEINVCKSAIYLLLLNPVLIEAINIVSVTIIKKISKHRDVVVLRQITNSQAVYDEDCFYSLFCFLFVISLNK